ncbi:MAG: N-acetylmuramoyl-L-alanine amidase, partial [Nannocystaceae bacterium]
LLYRKTHQRPDAPRVHTLTIEPKVIVLHFTDSDSLEVTWRYLNRETIEGKRPDIAAAGNVNVSTHFLIDRDGTVYRLMPETQFARHCIGLNHVAIGIENIGSAAEPLTEAQALANADLIRNLAARYPRLTHLIGHQEYRQMEGHAYFDERDPNYRTDKVDPGDAFLARVRGLVADLELSGPPS